MALRIHPDTASVLEKLRTAAAQLSDGDSIVDQWFRVPCEVELGDAAHTILVQDDLGWFFLKCMFLVVHDKGPEEVYFLNASAKLDRAGLSIVSRDGKLHLPEERARRLFGEISAELDAQLLGMEALRKTDTEIGYCRDTYLAPIAAYAATNL